MTSTRRAIGEVDVPVRRQRVPRRRGGCSRCSGRFTRRGRPSWWSPNEILTRALQSSAHRMPADAGASPATATYPGRRIGRNDRRSRSTPVSVASVREEQGAAAVGARQESGGGRHSKPRPPLSDDRSWAVQEVAYFLSVSESTVRNLERVGELPALPRIGTRIIFDPKIVRAFRDGWRPPPRGRAPARTAILARSDPRGQR